MTTASILLKNGHVIDPMQGIDGVCDVLLADGRIAAIGTLINEACVEEIDLQGAYVTPGWIDIHVHAYGTLGFSDVDSIGVYQGVTSMVDAGGTGILTLDEFEALVHDRTETNVYAGPHIHPLGIGRSLGGLGGHTSRHAALSEGERLQPAHRGPAAYSERHGRNPWPSTLSAYRRNGR